MIVGFDTETDLMGPGNVNPSLVCASFAMLAGEGVDTKLLHQSDPQCEALITALLEDPEVILVGANIAFDMAVLTRRYPHLQTLIWEAYFNGRIQDVIVMEKLYLISTSGDLDFMQMPSGAQKILYSLAALEKRRLGVDRSADKEGDDVWRLRYGELLDVPIEQWPAEAKNYATEDAIGPLFLYEWFQEHRGERGRPGSIETAGLQATADFALRLATIVGMPTDQERVALLEERLLDQIGPEKMTPLYEAGLLTAAKPPRQKKNGSGLTKPVPEKKNTKILRAWVEEQCNKHGLVPTYTAKTKQVQCNADILQQIAECGNELADLLLTRETYSKLLTTYVPVLKAERVHPDFNVLVTSGRTSSRGGSLYPSMNGQNQPRLSGDFSIRECFVPDEGYIWSSSDYGGLELCSVAQKTFKLFGASSVHYQKVNAGYDMHSYLGSGLAAAFSPEFAAIVRERKLDRDGAYRAFLAFKKSDDPKLRAFFKHWRTFAKPVGLGYPGGLGAKTMVIFARATYGVTMTEDQAAQFKEVWFEMYPEMRDYFFWVNAQTDPHNLDDYCYMTPLGMLRSGAAYTEAANGACMQSPAAEGAKAALILVQRKCYDPSLGSPLYGRSDMFNFIHDENMLRHRLDDQDDLQERIEDVEKTMIEQMQLVMPDVKITVETALMDRWYKEAEPVFDDAGRLKIWEKAG